MNTELIRMFNVALEGNEVDAVRLNMEALKRGYVVCPNCATQSVADFLQEENIDYNSTFYKDWKDVTDRSRLELFVDQCTHYFLSYGLDLAVTPNDGDRSDVPHYSKYKYIRPVTALELYDMCMNMLTTSVALKQRTVKALVDYVCDYVKTNKIDFDVDVIKNKEAAGMICNILNVYPNDPFMLLRYILTSTTGSSMIIKDKATISRIQLSSSMFDFSKLKEKQLKSLATIFYRFKPLFLAFRKHMHSGWSSYSRDIASRNKVVINKIRRMAKSYHKPFVPGFWETVLTPTDKVKKIESAIKNVKDITNFKIVQLIQSINDRLSLCYNGGNSLYTIRNGKVWLSDSDKKYTIGDTIYYLNLKELLENELASRLKEKACIVKFPKHLNLCCPSSEKNFVGDIPFGSYFDMTENTFFGIYWMNGWGTRDFDLSLIDMNGMKIGWNSYYYNSDQNIVYSGDVTNAPDGASEVILCKKGCVDSIININRFSGDEGSKYIFFFGQGDQNTVDEFQNRDRVGYMVNPDHIKVKSNCVSDSRQQALGIIHNNRAYIMNLGVAGGRVSQSNDELTKTLQRKLDTYVGLKSVLINAGFQDADEIDWTSPEYEGKKIELDLTDLNRDTLLELFK